MTLHFLASSACAYLTAEAWPISKPVQRLAGIRRLERNARRWRLWISRWIYEVFWSSACPVLRQCPRRNQVAPDFLLRDYPIDSAEARREIHPSFTDPSYFRN